MPGDAGTWPPTFRWWHAVILGAALILLSAAAGFAIFETTRQVGGGEPECSGGQAPNRQQPATAPGSTALPRPIVLAPVAGQRPLRVDFREHRFPRRAKVVFDASRPLGRRARRMTVGIRGDLLRLDDGERFPRAQIKAATVVSSNKRHVTVRLCFDPTRGRTVEPGRYEGTLLVEGPRIADVVIPVVVTLRDSRWWLVALWAVVAALGGVLVKLFVDSVKLATPPPGSNPGERDPAELPTHVQWAILISHALTPATALSVLLGAVAAFGALFVLYLTSDTFGASSSDWLKLIVYCFAATVSGMTVTDLGKRLPPGIR